MLKKFFPLLIPILFAVVLNLAEDTQNVLSYKDSNEQVVNKNTSNKEYWLLLKRKSNIEILYHGNPGNTENSQQIKSFIVKTGIPNKRPTPLPQLLGREYWLISDKFEIKENEEIGPFFLKLDIPYSEFPPYGPEPYQECNGQCDWEVPGSFGLHGVAGNNKKLSEEDEGSSGCIRHSDKDISFLYHLFRNNDYPIRYYIKDI